MTPSEWFLVSSSFLLVVYLLFPSDCLNMTVGEVWDAVFHPFKKRKSERLYRDSLVELELHDLRKRADEQNAALLAGDYHQGVYGEYRPHRDLCPPIRLEESA